MFRLILSREHQHPIQWKWIDLQNWFLFSAICRIDWNIYINNSKVCNDALWFHISNICAEWLTAFRSGHKPMGSIENTKGFNSFSFLMDWNWIFDFFNALKMYYLSKNEVLFKKLYINVQLGLQPFALYQCCSNWAIRTTSSQHNLCGYSLIYAI